MKFIEYLNYFFFWLRYFDIVYYWFFNFYIVIDKLENKLINLNLVFVESSSYFLVVIFSFELVYLIIDIIDVVVWYKIFIKGEFRDY